MFEAAVVASHQDLGFQAALQRLGTTRNLSGQLHFSTRRCRDGDPLDDTAVQGFERMLRVKARLDTVSAGHDGSGETVFETAHATADENKGIVGLHEVNESDCFRAEAAVAAATAGESEGTIRLLEVFESDFPSLPNSSHAHNSFLGSLSSACARRVARCVAAAPACVCLGSSSLAVSAAVAHAHASILHGACNSRSDTVRLHGPTGTRRVKGGVSGPGRRFASCLRGGGRGKFSAGRRCTGAGCRFSPQEATRQRYQARQGKCGHTFPPPGSSWYPIRVTWIRIGHQAIDGGFSGWSVQPKGLVRWHQPEETLHACARMDRHSCETHRSAPTPPPPPTPPPQPQPQPQQPQRSACVVCVAIGLGSKFTPTRASPAPSVRAVSVDGDESPSRDVNMGDVTVWVLLLVLPLVLVKGMRLAMRILVRVMLRGLGRLMPKIVLMVLLLRLGRSRSILAREGVWKPLGLLRLRRSLLGGGIILRSSVETLSRCLMIGWKSIRAFMRQIWHMAIVMTLKALRVALILR